LAADITPALRRGAGLCALTVGWNTIVGVSAVVTALSTGSLSLIGFGINAVVDSSASAVLVWRFRAAEAGHVEHAKRAELLALRLAAAAFPLTVCSRGLVTGLKATLRGHRIRDRGAGSGAPRATRARVREVLTLATLE